MKLVHTVHNWYLIILGCVTKVKAYKTMVYSEMWIRHR
jgi:hypothetical protein